MKDIKQEYVICNVCEDLLIYKPSSGTNSLSKHTCFCRETKVAVSGSQTSITQLYATSKNAPIVPRRLKQEIQAACVEFIALDCRPFSIIDGISFENLAQKIFSVGRWSAVSRHTLIGDLLPHPTTVRNILSYILLVQG